VTGTISVIPVPGATPDAAMLASEWLLTNALGGFAMGTAAGVPTRRYHAWLVASLKPPVRRTVALHSCVERVEVVRPMAGAKPGRESSPGASGPAGASGAPWASAPAVVELSAYRFGDGSLAPGGLANLVRFTRDPTGGCSWEYSSGGVTVVRSLALVRGKNACIVRYEVVHVPPGARAKLVVRPLVALRDFHSLMRHPGRDGLFKVEPSSAGVLVRGWWGDGPCVRLADGAGRAGACSFTHDEQWWWNFLYERERERGQDHLEDLFSPGEFVVEFDRPGAFELAVGVGRPGGAPDEATSFEAANATRRSHLAPIVSAGAAGVPSADAGACATLAAAADDFVVVSEPVSPGSKAGRTSVIAGYPWFADWGRDTLISLPGLMLATGRHAEALDTLRTFGAHVRAGLVPNRFDDFSGLPHYNTADASLWFVHAACEYLNATADRDGFDRLLKPACLEIVGAYQHGTSVPGEPDDRGGQTESEGAPIAMDPADGLIFAGSPMTQLTWMDAKRDGVVFTPRFGKPVELSALWHHALRALAEALAPAGPSRTTATGDPGDRTRAADLRTLADRVAASFRARFYQSRLGYCADCLVPGNGHASPAWTGATELRPNQLYAVSLEYSALLPEQQRSVVAAVGRTLVTPQGVRTLDPAARGYRGRYAGPLMELDAAYHNGTAWPYLLGTYAEAVLRSEGFSAESRRKARGVLAGLARRLSRVSSGAGDPVCLGQLPEVVDGDDESSAPQRAGGCPAQAWSVAECLRVLKLCGE
jgi:predicted glycogen debranching enzyme